MALRGLVAALVIIAPAFVPTVWPATAAPPPGPSCGVNLQAPQIKSAVASLRPALRTVNVAWDPIPYDGNYDPCATLSTALVTIAGATGSSPEQALFFHYGSYLGTATWDPYSFIGLDRSQTTDDLVVLDYKDGRDVCTACSGPINAVRYQWTGSRVEMLDPPPPRP